MVSVSEVDDFSTYGGCEAIVARTHYARSGETIRQIAAHYGVTVREIYDHNDNALIRIVYSNPDKPLSRDERVTIPDGMMKNALQSGSLGVTAYEAALMAQDVYNDTGSGSPAGWRRVDSTGWSLSGFSAATYVRGNVQVIAYRGTNDKADILVDLTMVPPFDPITLNRTIQALTSRYGLSSKSKLSWVGAGMLTLFFGQPEWQNGIRLLGNQTPAMQSKQALAYFDRVGQGVRLVVGHSLGGALAQVVAMEKNVHAISFNGPLMGDLRGTTPATFHTILLIHVDGDPLTLLTKEIGNQKHGGIISIPVKSLPGSLPIRQPIGNRGWAALISLPFNKLPAAKIAAETAKYLADMGSYMTESALYYHSIDTLCQAMATEPRYQQALDAGFGNLN